MKGGDAICQPPEGRWPDGFYDPTGQTPGTSYVNRAGWMQKLEELDAAFFGLSAHEASRMDPQQRMLLETTFEALEQAGLPLQYLRRHKVGVWVGLSSNDYMHAQLRDPKAANAYTNTGAASSIAANRISHAFDLTGPSMTVDTACSSGLTALHLAVQALRDGTCDTAIVGAANALLAPEFFVNFCAASMLSPVGQCRAFDAAGKGFVRAEGAVALVLRRRASMAGGDDPILGLVRASGCNNDGRTAGIALPSGEAQAALLQDVYRGIDPNELAYVEAHGTGTQAGNPQEAASLGHVLGMARSAPLPIGSVKTNLGHLEPVAGLVGLAKTLAAFAHGTVPPQIHFDTPNPEIDFEGLGLQVTQEPVALLASRPLVGINSFGFGGANAHVIIERPPLAPALPEPSEQRRLFAVFAADKAALQARAASLQDLASQAPNLEQLSTTLLSHQSHHQIGAAFHATSAAEVSSTFAAIADDAAERDDLVLCEHIASQAPAFVFTGNGPQWFAMGRVLMRENRRFRETVEEVSERFSAVSDLQLIDEMMRPETDSQMHLTSVAQPALFALQVGLTRCLADEWLRPGAVVGHSAGELAAAYVAGLHDLDTTVALVSARSMEQEKTAGVGAMAALGLNAEGVKDLLLDHADLVLAADNAPDAVTVAGAQSAIDRIVEQVTASGRFARKLRLNYAFHSPAMDPIEQSFRDRIAHASGAQAEVPFFSSVTGDQLMHATTVGYWWRNLRAPVRFRAAIEAMIDQGHRLFVEIGPHPTLVGYVKTTGRKQDERLCVAGTLRRGGDDVRALETAIETLVASGARIHVPRARKVRPLTLPSYPWQRERHWHVPARDPGQRKTDHALLGRQIAEGMARFSKTLSLVEQPWLADHMVRDQVLFPAAGFLEAAIEATIEHTSSPCVELQHVKLDKALRLDHAAQFELQTELTPAAQRFEILSRSKTGETPFERHAAGIFTAYPAREARLDLQAVLDRLGAPASAPHHYAQLEARGLKYGPAFQTVSGISGNSEEILVQLNHQPDANEKVWLHPGVLDGALQALCAFADAKGGQGLFLPVFVARLVMIKPLEHAQTVLAYIKKRGANRAYIKSDITLTTPDGDIFAELEGVEARHLPGGAKDAELHYAEQLEPIQSFGLPRPPLDLEHVLGTQSDAAETDRFDPAIFPAMDTLRRRFVSAAFAELTGGAEFRLEDLVAPGTLSEVHARYAAELLADAAGSPGLSQTGETFKALPHPLPWEDWAQTVDRFPDLL
jgi:acyl transferase domain-containing protein